MEILCDISKLCLVNYFTLSSYSFCVKMNELERRKEIIDKWNENPNLPVHFIAKQLKMAKSTVKDVLERYFETLSISRKQKKNQKKGPRNEKLEEKIVEIITKNRSMSIRDVAKKCGTNGFMVQNCKKRNGLKTRKKSKAPKVSEKQQKVIKTRSRKLYQLLGDKNVCVVMDDETYVKADFRTLPGSQYYTQFEGEILPSSETTIGVEKFGAKYLVWQAICQCGKKSSSFISTGTINAEVYREECLKKRLIPFLKKHDGSTIFWPDLATAHYATTTLNLLRKNNIEFVSKDKNPPNVPQCRPIERYWALIKNNLRKSNQASNDIKDFEIKWKDATKKISKNTVINLMKDIRKKLRIEWTRKFN